MVEVFLSSFRDTLGLHDCKCLFTDDICDMIKGNELDVGNIEFELQAKRGDKFVCFALCLNFKECSYLRNQMIN